MCASLKQKSHAHGNVPLPWTELKRVWHAIEKALETIGWFISTRVILHPCVVLQFAVCYKLQSATLHREWEFGIPIFLVMGMTTLCIVCNLCTACISGAVINSN